MYLHYLYIEDLKYYVHVMTNATLVYILLYVYMESLGTHRG